MPLTREDILVGSEAAWQPRDWPRLARGPFAGGASPPLHTSARQGDFDVSVGWGSSTSPTITSVSLSDFNVDVTYST